MKWKEWEKWEMGPFLLRSRSEWWSSAWLDIAVDIKIYPCVLLCLKCSLYLDVNRMKLPTFVATKLLLIYLYYYSKTTFYEQGCQESSKNLFIVTNYFVNYTCEQPYFLLIKYSSWHSISSSILRHINLIFF